MNQLNFCACWFRCRHHDARAGSRADASHDLFSLAETFNTYVVSTGRDVWHQYIMAIKDNKHKDFNSDSLTSVKVSYCVW
jgi:hypothetical protein